jgi:hypothetical protein
MAATIFRTALWLGMGLSILSGTAEASSAYSTPVPQIGTSAQSCGVGTCFGHSYCDDCLCYSPDSPVSQLHCGCSRCGEVTPGCGLGTCVGASFCDSCLCYSPAAATSQTCCPGGTGNFQVIYERPAGFDYGHSDAGVQTFDGGFILAGFGYTANVVRTDGAGHVLWSKLIGGQITQWWDVEEAADGFLLTGTGGLVKLDRNGSLVWAKALPNNGIGYGVNETSDGNLVVAGTMNGQAFLLMTDADGSLQWGWTYAGSAEARSAVELPTGGFMVFGSTQDSGAGGYDLLFIQTDDSGTLQWAKTAGGAQDDKDSVLPYRMIGTTDGGFAVATATQSFGGANTMLVMKLDASANVVWANTYGDGEAEAIVQTLHGYYVMGTNGEERVMALDPTGNPLWARNYGDTPYHNYLGGGLAEDGGAFVATESHLNPVGTHKFLLIKTDADGRTGCANETSFSVAMQNVSITTAPATLTATALSGPLSTIGISLRDGGLVDRDLCRSSPGSRCELPPVCRPGSESCPARLPPL